MGPRCPKVDFNDPPAHAGGTDGKTTGVLVLLVAQLFQESVDALKQYVRVTVYPCDGIALAFGQWRFPVAFRMEKDRAPKANSSS